MRKFCTVCLQNNVNLKSIHTKDSNNILILDKLKYAITSLDKNLHGCPLHICKECNNKLSNVYIFKQQFVKNITTYIRQFSKLHSDDVFKRQIINSKTEDTNELDLGIEGNKLEKCRNPECITSFQEVGGTDFEVNQNQSTKKNIIGDSELSASVSRKNIDNNNKTQLFNCPICTKMFKHKHSLTSHMRIHSGEKPYECNVCSKTFRQQSTLIEHMRIHSGEKPFECSVCLKSFRHQSNLRKHMRIHTGEKSSECSVCMKTFSLQSSLIRHMKVHSDEKPFKCNICMSTFRHHFNLIQHMRIHSGEKSYKCSVCMKTFSHQNSLTRHMKIHSGEKPFKCTICFKTFRLQTALTYHMSNVHTKTPV